MRAVLAARAGPPAPALAADHPLVRTALAELTGPDARAALEADPYWPKWDGPWWSLQLLRELGHAAGVPRAAVREVVAAAGREWLASFPRTDAELAAALAERGRAAAFDPVRHVACFCALGSLQLLCDACGVDLDLELPWWRRWIVEYQLPDGGWNCDEAAHVRPAPCGSVVSTAVVLEALLARRRRAGGLTPAEAAALDGGARYLLARSLFRSLRRGGAPIDARWLAPAFPRFYGYDVLRGLGIVTRWARATGAPLEAAALVDALEAVAARVGPDGLPPAPNDLVTGASTTRVGPDGTWTRGPAASTPLLEHASRPDAPSAGLTRAWSTVLDDLAALDAAGQLG